MPVLALNEKGLTLDVFGSSPTFLKGDAYLVRNNKLVYTFNSQIIFFDLISMKQSAKGDLPGFVEMKMSDDGSKTAVMGCNKKLVVFDRGVRLMEIPDVEVFDLSSTFLAAATKDTLSIHSFGDGLTSLNYKIHSISCHNSFICFTTQKDTDQKLCVYYNKAVDVLLQRPNLYRIKTVTNKEEGSVLIQADVEYFGKSYYAESILYLLVFGPTTNVERKALTIVERNDVLEFSSFSGLKKVHDFGFLKDGFFVCFGDQPANLHKYTNDGLFIKKETKTYRNKIVINDRENIVINCGLGNLPGCVEVSREGQTSAKLEILGASIVEFERNDSFFIVAITNYFKSDNKILLYDYYGNVLKETKWDSLVSACVYGQKEAPVVLPEKSFVKKEASVYVPPHLLGLVQPLKKAPVKSKPRTYKTVKKELEEALSIRERVNKKEEVTLEEENKMFRISQLEEELHKLTAKCHNDGLEK